jgi:flagellar biosynthesis/type III secretory pathway protein FliH
MAQWTVQDDNDEFFGLAHDDNDEHHDNLLGDAKEESLHLLTTDGLAKHENRATEERYRNMGYLEAFEASKEARLQDGFEAGYRDAFELAMRIGDRFGKAAAQSRLLRDPVDAKSRVAAATVIERMAQSIRSVLERIELSEEKGEAEVHELEKVESQLQDIEAEGKVEE